MISSAFLFPGQGSQYAGMGKELVSNFTVARQVFEEADDVLGFSLSGLCFNGPDEELKLTFNTQPAILATSVAALKVLQQETGHMATCVAGHSLGEYSALVCSGALSLADAVRTVRSRGTFMQEAIPVGVGAMAAMLSIDKDELEQICAEAAQGEVVAPANFNSPGQIVIAGHASAVNRAIELAKSKGYRKAMLLPVSAPFHCSLMQPAAEKLALTLDRLNVHGLAMPVITNVEAKPNIDVGRVKELLVAQVCAPVCWEQSILAMVQLGVERFIEVGPGKVLSGLVKRISKGVPTASIEDLSTLQSLPAA